MRWLLLGTLAWLGCAPSIPPIREAPAAPSEVAAVSSSSEPRAAQDSGALALDGATLDGGVDPLLRLADEITSRMTSLRSLARREPIVSGLLSREEILQRLRARIHEEYPGDELAREGLLYRVLGLWNDPRDYADTTFDLLEEQVAGFYDPTRKRLYVAAWLSAFSQGPTLAHEITHALQDQHFDLARFTRHAQGAGDRQLAAMTVVEGDATLATIAFSAGRQGLVPRARAMASAMANSAGGGERLSTAPLVLRETLIFPYREGLRLCTDAYESGGWTAVDALLREPPQSSEQVLHTDKLSAREPPVSVELSLPPSLSGTHRIAYRETFGELGVRLWLRTWLDEALSDDAAAGWGGDLAVLLVPRDTTEVSSRTLAASLWLITMDASPVDREALELERAAVALLRQRHPRGRRVRLTGVTHAVQTSADTVAFVARRGRSVLVAEGLARERAANVAQEALANAPSRSDL